MICATEYTQSGDGRFLAYIPSMMEKSALGGEGGGVRAHPLSLVTITYKDAVYAPTVRADTLALFHLTLYVLCGLRVHATPPPTSRPRPPSLSLPLFYFILFAMKSYSRVRVPLKTSVICRAPVTICSINTLIALLLSHTSFCTCSRIIIKWQERVKNCYQKFVFAKESYFSNALFMKSSKQETLSF
jgi:hypothetical protein